MNTLQFLGLMLAIPILGLVAFILGKIYKLGCSGLRKIRDIWRKFRKKPTRAYKIEPHL